VLQCVAVCCSVLQYIAVRERVHAKNATRAPGQRAKTNHLDVHSVCSVSLQHNATHCNTLQHTATHRNALVNRTCVNLSIYTFSVLQCVAVCCSVLQCVAVCLTNSLGVHSMYASCRKKLHTQHTCQEYVL